MQLAICWSESSHCTGVGKKSNCSSHFVSRFMDVLNFASFLPELYIIENLLSVIVAHSNDLLMSPDTPARVWHLR